jgi:DNA topoisomerase-3
MSKLLAEGRTSLLPGFVSSRTRRKFKAYLVRGADGKTGFEFEPRPERPGKPGAARGKAAEDGEEAPAKAAEKAPAKAGAKAPAKAPAKKPAAKKPAAGKAAAKKPAAPRKAAAAKSGAAAGQESADEAPGNDSA